MNSRKPTTLFTTVVLLACGSNMPNAPVNAGELTTVKAFPALTFASPVFLTHSNDGTDRIFVVERQGLIKVFENDAATSTAANFLDIRDRVTAGGEMGLLGLAFHPDFGSNGLFFVNYTTSQNGPRRTVVAKFSATGNSADPGSELVLLQVDQPFSNHNGGMIAFGPDGKLYIGLGDGGSGGDPQNHGQRRSTLLGSILRIDVDNQDLGLNYAIPADNPFASTNDGTRKEIFAYGLRNPWRFSIDQTSGQIWAGDVGQGRKEEVDLIESGQNYGWNTMEGFDCFNPSSDCDQNGLTLPVVDYGRSEGFSITGGYIYRGQARSELTGAYIYGDFGSGNVWMLRYENNQLTADSLLLDTDLSLSSFGVDEQDELYLVDLGGEIYRFSGDPTTSVAATDQSPVKNFTLHQNFPNPFNPETVIRYELAAAGEVTLAIFNQLGQKIRTLLNTEQQAGTHQSTWDGRNSNGQKVASGHYFYKVQTGAQIFTKSMTLVR